MVSNIHMKKEEYITVYDLQIRVRPVPSWEADGSRCHVFLCQPVGGGNGIHLRGDKAADVAFDLADMCRGQEL